MNETKSSAVWAKRDYYPTQLLLPKKIRPILELEATRSGLTPAQFARSLIMRHLHDNGLLDVSVASESE